MTCRTSRFSPRDQKSFVSRLILTDCGCIRIDHGLPRLAALRTAEITNRLHDLSLDFGIVRREAVSLPLKCAPLGKMEYALFCPRDRFDKAPDVRRLFETLPLAMQRSDGVNVAVKIECDAFPQASRAVQPGKCAAILPTIARGDLPGDAFWKIDVPFLNKKPRQLCLAWNPRTLRLRTEASALAENLEAALRF